MVTREQGSPGSRNAQSQVSVETAVAVSPWLKRVLSSAEGSGVARQVAKLPSKQDWRAE